MSAAGGMDIEEVARNTPEKIIRYNIDPLIGLHQYLAQSFAFMLFDQAEQAKRRGRQTASDQRSEQVYRQFKKDHLPGRSKGWR
jgi:hypothetical protein